MTTAFIVLTQTGLTLARTLRPSVPGAQIHGLAGRADEADIVFHDSMAHLRALHRDGVTIIGLCAAGILIRALAPNLSDKRRDAPVISVAEDGSVVVPLIGGHHGANELAKKLATACNGVAAITTAGDLRLGFSFDSSPPGWQTANPEAVKPVTAALLSGDGARLKVNAGSAEWLARGPWRDDATAQVLVTDRIAAPDDQTLVIHPPVLTIGVGCERGTSPEELTRLVTDTLEEAGLAAGAVAAIGSLDLKIDEPAVHAAATALQKTARFFEPAELEAEAPRLQTPSDLVFRETGCHGVAEGAALALAGPDAELIVPKRKSRRATCAIARAPEPITENFPGTTRGLLSVVGIGPGTPAWRSPEASAALESAEIIVGYSGYLDLIDTLAPQAERRAYGLGQEAARVRDALTLAGDGKQVALVCSGDPGVYALATLVFETIESNTEPAWRRAEIIVAPGITAMQAAAARAGAPLGHDFCAISLSDLLTSRETIIQRLEAAAEGDFVTAFYNPQSQRRRDLLAHARDVFAEHRPPSTPVIVARNLGRADETTSIIPLSEFDLDSVDMLTIVIFGNSQTRLLNLGDGPRAYTPRGYGTMP